MVFHKVVKSKAYFKRYQTKFRRRREGKTDYYARKRLVVQSKNKYAAPKYRLVTRITNKYVLVQVVAATVDHDEVLAAACSRELPHFGLSVGLNNYAAAYCTGLLAARRLLKKMGLDAAYEGTTEVDGEVNSFGEAGGRTFFVRDLDDERRPFRVNLDVGIHTTTTGAKVFGAMKGASDGGLDIPHSDKRFPGDKGGVVSAERHRERIFGQHVANYMREMQEEEPEEYQKHFSAYIKAGVDADSLEELYTSVHAAIRADPTGAPKKDFVPDKKHKNRTKMSLAQRKARVAQKKAARARRLAADLSAMAADEDEEEEEED